MPSLNVGRMVRNSSTMSSPRSRCRNGGISVVVASPTPMIGTALDSTRVTCSSGNRRLSASAAKYPAVPPPMTPTVRGNRVNVEYETPIATFVSCRGEGTAGQLAKPRGDAYAWQVREEVSEPKKVLTLLVELRCNSYCIFCGQREVDEALIATRRRLGLSMPQTTFGDTRGRYTLETATAALETARAEGYTDLS